MSENNEILYHCFGTEESFPVTPTLAAKMIIASEIKSVPINTHNIGDIFKWDALPLGYGKATWSCVSYIHDMTNCSPVWNINLAETSNEVIERVERALELGGKKPVKLEVLDKQHKVTINREVIKSVEFLRNKIEDLEIWPLIYPDETDFIELCKFNCRIIRLMGSPISSKKGVENGLFSTIINIINMKGRPAVMLDGGIGKWEDIDKALDIGFDKFLVNSCLFDSKNKPDESLLNIKQKLENKIKTNKKI